MRLSRGIFAGVGTLVLGGHSHCTVHARAHVDRADEFERVGGLRAIAAGQLATSIPVHRPTNSKDLVSTFQADRRDFTTVHGFKRRYHLSGGLGELVQAL